MKCYRCGNEYDDKDRACMKCGALNSKHPLNKNVLSIINDSINKEEKMKAKKKNVSVSNVSIRDDRMALIPLIIVNIVIFILFIIMFLSSNRADITTFAIYIVLHFYFVCFQLLLWKAGLPWWGLFVPFYNFYLHIKLAFRHTLFIIILYIGINGILSFMTANAYMTGNIELYYNMLKVSGGFSLVCSIVYLFCLGRRFGNSGILTVLFSVFEIPILAFSGRFQYQE